MQIAPHLARAVGCAALILVLLTQHDSGRRREPVESGPGWQTGRLHERGAEPGRNGRASRR